MADMALGVVGNVNEEAAEGGRQGFLADGAGLLEVGVGQGQNSCASSGKGGIEFGEKFGVGGGSGFGVQLRLLVRIQ